MALAAIGCAIGISGALAGLRALQGLLFGLSPTDTVNLAGAAVIPVLGSLAAVLDETPSLLDKAHAVVPPVTGVVASLLPVLDYLRPYTPEVAGLLSNLASASANYDANGHFLRIYVSSGTLLLGSVAGQLNPAITKNPDRPPGEREGQPLTDAAGSTVR